MSNRNEVISGEHDSERRRNKRDKFICSSPRQNDERDESFRHCGCLQDNEDEYNEKANDLLNELV